MPSQRKRIGYLPSEEVHEIIDKLCRANEFSQSKVTGLLVEEALRSRGVLNESFVQNVDFIFTSTLGDINYDGIVNVQDAIILVSSILLSENNNEYDFNNDSIVNIIDIIILINLILDYE